MNSQYLAKVFSAERIDKYVKYHNNDYKKAYLHYSLNIKISESLYPCISILEVSLRNAINRELIKLFGTKDWYNHFSNTPGLIRLNKEITEAQQKVSKRNELITASKIVAELNLGFWVRLFNTEFHNILWKNLRKAFPNLPKNERKRKTVSAPLNNFRNLRNRIFHNEPISWNINQLEKLYIEIKKLLFWIDKDLTLFLDNIDRFRAILKKFETKLKT